MSDPKTPSSQPFDLDRFLAEPPSPRPAGDLCRRYHDLVDRQLAEQCAGKVNEMEPSPGNPACPCHRDPASSGVDLVVLVDASGSMSATWKAIGEAAEAAIAGAAEACKVKPRVTWLYVDPSDAGTGVAALPAPFAQSHERYLVDHGVGGPFAADADGPLDSEQGAKAIVDLSNHFDWRRGACRGIFYVSDEMLDSSGKTMTDSRTATDAAIAVAQAAGVTVFTHFVDTSRSKSFPAAQYDELAGHYKDLAEQTGGQAKIGGDPTAALYTELLRDAICRACGGSRCVVAELPDLRPCIHVSWGDSDCDCIESDDFETLCVTVCNCYSNVTFANLSIQLAVVRDDGGGAVAVLPDGTPSVEVIPPGPICFGDVGPCVDGEETCVSRQLVLRNRGAKAGRYQLRLHGICFDLVHHYFLRGARFDFEICRD